MSKPLTDRQEMFCLEYIVDLNATKAAIRAGYSERSARQEASRLMTNDDISSRIQELMDERAKKVEVTSAHVLSELLKLAMVDIAGAYDENGNLKQIHDIPEEVRKAIAGVETYYERVGTDEDGNPDLCTVKKVKFWDKPKSLELLGKHLKLFTEKHEVTGKDGKDLMPASDEEIDAKIKALMEASNGNV